MNNVDISLEEGLESPAWFGDVEPFVRKILADRGIDGWELSVLFCTDAFIQNLNKSYRDIDAPTDILSFEDGDEYIDDDGVTWYSAGDIAISIATFTKNAAEFGVPVEEELKRLLIHGVLHLSGLDHGEAHIGKDRTFEGGSDEERQMLVLQEEILERLTK